MARINLNNLAHSYDPNPTAKSEYALHQMNHVWEDGGAYALLGPSGCGKTTLLNIISGLLRPSQGRILFDDQDVTALSPQQRNIAQVFQFPVIYDTMSVYDNLAFPLRNRKIAENDITTRVLEIAEMLDLQEVLQSRAANLSADAKQKISLGRGLVRSDVAAILFDEPLTVIDPHMKLLLRRKLKQIHARFKLTMVYVTHDQLEALTFADKVVVMNAGQVLQIGTPQELFESPKHTFVGYFIGSPGMNIIPAQLDGGLARIGGHAIPLMESLSNLQGDYELGIRPEFLILHDSPGDNRQPVDVLEIEGQGNCSIVTVRFCDHNLKVKVPEGQTVPQQSGYIEFPPDWIRIYQNSQLVGDQASPQPATEELVQ